MAFLLFNLSVAFSVNCRIREIFHSEGNKIATTKNSPVKEAIREIFRGQIIIFYFRVRQRR